MSWNGYASFTRNSIIKQLKTSPKKVQKEKDDRKIIWIRLPYLGNIDDSLRKNCFKRVQKCLKENVHSITCYGTKKTKMFCLAKYSIPIHQKANLIYKVTCPGCNEDYVGKTDHNLVTRLNERASYEDQPMYQHLSKCEHFAYIIDLHKLPHIDTSTTEIITNNNFLTLFFLTFVFRTPVVTGPNCYF